MKSTGMVRKLDELGRLVMPSEIRQTMGINVRDSMEIFTDGDRIVLQKYNPMCFFCNSGDDLVYFNNKRICRECIEKLKTQF